MMVSYKCKSLYYRVLAIIMQVTLIGSALGTLQFQGAVGDVEISVQLYCVTQN